MAAGLVNTGTRIRDRRIDAALRQAELAQMVGISPSYLNLIEHNKRRIGGKLLADIARRLGCDPTALTQGADGALVDHLRRAAAGVAPDDLRSAPEVDRLEEFATRYPGWAGVVDRQFRQIERLSTRLRNMSDRLAHDPELATALHDIISAVTSIQATAEILVGEDTVDTDWQQRFHRNIHDESLRLAAESEALVRFLERPRGRTDTVQAPDEEVCTFLMQSGFHQPALETGGAATTEQFVTTAPLSDAGQGVLRRWCAAYTTRAARMPLGRFGQAARACAYDPLALAHEFGAGLGDVLRHLASLPQGAGHPPMGLVTCDPAGAVLYLQPVTGFPLDWQTGSCPLWPVYQAFGQPGQPVRAQVSLPDYHTSEVLCYAVAEHGPVNSYDTPPVAQSTMLVMPDPPDTGLRAQPVGVTCRICPRTDCSARREPLLQ